MTEYAIVPTEPTEAMIEAAANAGDANSLSTMKAIWAAMLATAPQKYRQVGVILPNGEFTTYEGVSGEPVYVREDGSDPAPGLR